MRLFIAINLHEELRVAVYDACAPLRALLPDARWVEPELLHMTVKFIGETPGESVAAIGGAMDRVGEAYRSIPCSLGGMGAFPNLRRPSIVWMAVQGDSKLELLHDDVERACSVLGIPVEGRAFRPHLTLARVRSFPAGLQRRFADACAAVAYESRFPVESLDLMQSEQLHGRLTYTLLHSASLSRE